MKHKVIGAVWFTPMGGACIGIVMVETEYDGIVFYIGQGVGVNQENDEQLIAERGAQFPWHVGMELFGKALSNSEGNERSELLTGDNK